MSGLYLPYRVHFVIEHRDNPGVPVYHRSTPWITKDECWPWIYIAEGIAPCRATEGVEIPPPTATVAEVIRWHVERVQDLYPMQKDQAASLGVTRKTLWNYANRLSEMEFVKLQTRGEPSGDGAG